MMWNVLFLCSILLVFLKCDKECSSDNNEDKRYLRDFKENPELGREYDVFVVVKSFMQIEKNLRAYQRKKEKVFGRTHNRGYDYGCVFSTSLDTDMLQLSDAFWRYCTKEPSCVDVHEDRGTILLTGGDRLIEFDILNGDINLREIHNSWFRQLHTARYSADGKRILVTSTGFDNVIELDTETMEVTWEYDLWANGYGVSKRGDHFTRSEEEARRLDRLGASVILVTDPLQWPDIGIPTGVRACHTNGAFYDSDEDLIGVTMAHKSTAIFVNRTSMKVQEIPVLENMIEMVHAFNINDNDFPCNGYTLADTKGGNVVFMDKDLTRVCDRISLDGMEPISPGREEVGEWMQYVTRIDGDLYNMVDVHRNMIHLFDVRKGERRSIKYPIEYAIQEVSLIKKSTSEGLKKLPFYFFLNGK